MNLAKISNQLNKYIDSVKDEKIPDVFSYIICLEQVLWVGEFIRISKLKDVLIKVLFIKCFPVISPPSHLSYNFFTVITINIRYAIINSRVFYHYYFYVFCFDGSSYYFLRFYTISL